MENSLTQQAHDAIRAYLQPGSVVVDATAGNGHDTLFLAQAVGSSGHVIALDIQEDAIHATRARLNTAELRARVTLCRISHDTLETVLLPYPPVRVVMFNLGYLPGSDKTVVTQPKSTLRVLEQARRHLAAGGIISVITYRGHSGGVAEYDAVAAWMRQRSELGDQLTVHPAHHDDNCSPVLFLLLAHD